MGRPKQRTPQLRATVLREAVAILADRGVSGLTARSVASAAGTSTPAVYELFGDKAGLVREVFVEGFRRLGARLAAVPDTDDAVADLVEVAHGVRRFLADEPQLGRVMFSHPFADFAPGPEDRAAAASVRTRFTGPARRAVAAGRLVGDPVDISHVLLGVVQGLWLQQEAGWLGTSEASVQRRWEVAVDSVLRGSLVP